MSEEEKPEWIMPPLPLAQQDGSTQDDYEMERDFRTDHTVCTADSELEFEHSQNSNNAFHSHQNNRSTTFELKYQLDGAYQQIDVLKQTIKSMERQLSYMYQSNTKSTRTMENGRSMAQLNKANSDSLQLVLDKEIFPYIKFIPKDEIHNIREGSIASRVMSNLGLPQDKWPEYWANQSSIVWYLFNTERTRFVERLKKQFVKGNVTCLHVFLLLHMKSNKYFICEAFLAYKENNLNKLEHDVFELIMKSNYDFGDLIKTQENYSVFFCLFGKAAMKAIEFKMITVDNYEDKMTVCREAFCLVCLENNFERWRSELNLKYGKDQTNIKNAKLTKEEEQSLPNWRYTREKCGNIKLGWSSKGHQKYDEYFKLCEHERTQPDKRCKYTFALANSKEMKQERATNAYKKRQSLKEKDTVTREVEEVHCAVKRRYDSAFPNKKL